MVRVKGWWGFGGGWGQWGGGDLGMGGGQGVVGGLSCGGDHRVVGVKGVGVKMGKGVVGV